MNEYEKVDQILEGIAKNTGGGRQEKPTTPKLKNSNLNYWFWGTIAFLIVSTLSLTIVAQNKTAPKQPVMEGTLKPEPEIDKQNDLPKEFSASELREIFDKTYQPALDSTLALADNLIEAAYAPVYGRIPAYTDWHYSVWGSYVELGTAALASPEEVLEERLLDGLSDRLEGLPDQLTTAYSSKFKDELNLQLNSFSIDGRKIGPLSEIILIDAVAQTGTSGLVFAGGSAFGKLLSSVIIKKIGAKIAIKMGSKWAAAAGGAGGGAVLCAWAGPAAAACAVGGGLLTFFGVDAGVNYLDKKFTSAEFKAELQEQLDTSKQKQKDYFRDQIEQMVKLQKVSLDYNLQDFTLKQLAQADRDSVCAATKLMIEEYDLLKENLSSRSDDNVLKLHKKAESSISEVGLFEVSKEITTNLNSFENYILVSPKVISGRLPSEYTANRKLSGSLKINNINYSLQKSSVASDFVNLPISDEDKTNNVYFTDKNMLRIAIEIEQHRVFRNRFFVSEMAIRRDEFLANGTKGTIKTKVSFAPKDDKAARDSFPLYLSFAIQAEELAPLEMKPECAK